MFAVAYCCWGLQIFSALIVMCWLYGSEVKANVYTSFCYQGRPKRGHTLSEEETNIWIGANYEARVNNFVWRSIGK